MKPSFTKNKIYKWYFPIIVFSVIWLTNCTADKEFYNMYNDNGNKEIIIDSLALDSEIIEELVLSSKAGIEVSLETKAPVIYGADERATVVGPVTITALSTPQEFLGRDGVSINLVRYGKHGWDDRLPYYDASLGEQLPITLQPGDVAIVAGSIYGENEPRNAKIEYMVINCVSELPSDPDTYFSPAPIRSPLATSPRVSYNIDLDALISELPTQPINGPVPSIEDIKSIFCQDYPTIRMIDADHNVYGYEPFIAPGMSMRSGYLNKGYSQFLVPTFAFAAMYIHDPATSLEDRKEILAWMIRHGLDAADPIIEDGFENTWDNGGGHNQFAQIAIVYALKATGRDEIARNWLNYENCNAGIQPFIMTEELLATCKRHNNTKWPFTYKEREILAIEGNVMTLTSDVYDPYWFVGDGLLVIDQDNEVATITSGQSSTRREGYNTFKIEVDDISIFSVGDVVSFEPPYELHVGNPYWSIGGSTNSRPPVRNLGWTSSWSTFNPHHHPQYYPINQGTLPLIVAVRMLDVYGPRWQAVEALVMASRHEDYPAAGFDYETIKVTQTKTWNYSPSMGNFYHATEYYDSFIDDLLEEPHLIKQ